MAYTIGEERFVMEPGDAIFFDASEPHTPRNVGEGEATLLVIYIFKNAK